MTLGIELLLAADIRLASSDVRFAQLEIQRGIYPFGGATIRLPREAGWGNAMRWLLTGDEYDATEAHRIGLIQEITKPGAHLDRAVELAERIAGRSAPLAVRTTLSSAQRAMAEGHAAAAARLNDDMVALLRTEDGTEGMMSFLERRPAQLHRPVKMPTRSPFGRRMKVKGSGTTFGAVRCLVGEGSRGPQIGSCEVGSAGGSDRSARLWPVFALGCSPSGWSTLGDGR